MTAKAKINYRMLRYCTLAAVCFFPCLRCPAQMGFDTGLDAPGFVAKFETIDPLIVAPGRWLRIRGVAGNDDDGNEPRPNRDKEKEGSARRRPDTERPGTLGSDMRGAKSSALLASTRQALHELHVNGFRVCVLLRWEPDSWPSGVRWAGGGHLPLDLREAFERCRFLGEAYSGLVDAWEIDDEPDIAFMPELAENYAAYLKACRLGFEAGLEPTNEREGAVKANAHQSRLPPVGERTMAPAQSTRIVSKGGSPLSANDVEGFRQEQASGSRLAASRPLVLMAAVALPPGPWLERFIENDGLAYTDGFNFHYYGYAADFSDVYRQFEAAVTAVSKESAWRIADGRRSTERKALPVFMTEVGYGMLGASARDTKEGRLRQWRWFHELSRQLPALRAEATMAFLLKPYLENGTYEFGLSAVPHEGPESGGQGQEIRGRMDEGLKPEIQDAPDGRDRAVSKVPPSGPIAYSPSDFGASRSESWLDLIGRRLGAEDITPALAELLAAPPKVRKARPWSANVSAGSPVVIDFVAGAFMAAIKGFNGYVLHGNEDVVAAALEGGAQIEGKTGSHVPRSGSSAVCRAQVIVYNFSGRPLRGELKLPACMHAEGNLDIELESMARWVVDIETVVPADRVAPLPVEIRFRTNAGAAPEAVLRTAFFPDVIGMKREEIASLLGRTPARESDATLLESRYRATEEAPERWQNGWLVQDGVDAKPVPGGYLLTVSHPAPGKERRIEAELPWPHGLEFPADALLSLDYRLIPEGRPAGARKSELVSVNVRTANGNLYQVYPPREASARWRNYLEPRDNFTMAFYCRAKPPWRFRDNRPVSLVFVLYPEMLPAQFEIRNMALVREK